MSSPQLSAWREKKEVRGAKDVKSFWQQMPTKLFGVKSSSGKSQLLSFHPLKRKASQTSLLDSLFVSPKHKFGSRRSSLEEISKPSPKTTPKRKGSSQSRPYSSTAVQKAKTSPTPKPKRSPAASSPSVSVWTRRPINRVVLGRKDKVSPLGMPSVRSPKRREASPRVSVNVSRRGLEEGEIDEEIEPVRVIEPVDVFADANYEERSGTKKRSPSIPKGTTSGGSVGRKRNVSPRRKKRSISVEKSTLVREKVSSPVPEPAIGIGTGASPIVIPETDKPDSPTEEMESEQQAKEATAEDPSEADQARGSEDPARYTKGTSRVKKQIRALALLSSYNNLPPGRTLLQTGRRRRKRTVKLEPGVDDALSSGSHSRPANKRGSKRKRVSSGSGEDDANVLGSKVAKKMKVEPGLEKLKPAKKTSREKSSAKTAKKPSKKKKKKRSRTRQSLEAELRSKLMDPLPNLDALVGLSSIAALLSIPKVSELADDGFAKEGFTVEQRCLLDKIAPTGT